MAIVTACCLGMMIASTTKAPDDPSAPASRPLPVRWNRTEYPWMTSIADCDRLWRTHPVGGAPPSDTL